MTWPDVGSAAEADQLVGAVSVVLADGDVPFTDP
jgi:hypothetical protein